MTKTTRCLLCVALICAIALLLPAVRAQAEGENPTYAYDSATKTLTITPGTSGLIGKEIQNESDYYSKWTKEVEKVIIAGDIRGIGTIGEDHNLVDGVFLTWRKLKEVEYQGKTQFYVGDYAFYACGELASFPLEWAVDFGYGAMMQSALEEVKIPHLQGNIGDCAFWLITPLKTVDITIENGQNRNTYIGTKAFASDYSRVPNLTSVTIRGEGTLEFGPRHPDMDLGQMFSYQTQLETVDLSGFSGDLSFGSAAFFQDASLKEIKLNPASKITYIGYDTFSGCENLDLSSWNFANLTGIIDQAGFGIRSWGDVMYGRGVLSDFTSLDLSNVKEIAIFAFTAESEYEGYGYTKLESVNLSSLERLHSFAFQGAVNIDWDKANLRDDVKLAYSDVLARNDGIWDRILKILDDRFALDQEGSYGPLSPSDNRWEDSKIGLHNRTDAGSTQLTKSAKWTNEAKTTAQVEIQAAWAPDPQMDFVFILDTSTSMGSWCDVDCEDSDLLLPAQGEAQYAKMYEMQSKLIDVTEKLLSSPTVDSRVAIVTFGDETNYESGKFIETAQEAAQEIRGLLCVGATDYTMGLDPALKYVQQAQADGRNVAVVFLSDGEDNCNNNNPENIKNSAKAISDLGVKILGVMYKDNPSDDDKMSIEKACTEIYLAKDTEEFSRAVNRTIYDSFHTYTLTDVVNEAYFAIDTNAVQAIKTSAGQATLDEDGKTIFWDLSGTDPYTTYTMTIELELKKLQGTDEYPTGKLPTNEGDAPLAQNGALPGTSVNQVQTPVLSRGLAEIRPADVTIYMGGSGYQGAIDGAGTALGEGSGFPVPGYIITPPAGVTDFDASQATLKYENGTDIRRWTIVTYDGVPNAAHNIYRFQPVDPTNRVYVRMQFKAGDTAVSVDEVDFSEYLYQDLTMEVYGVGIEAGYVTLEYKGVEYPIVAGTGMLKVRGTTEQELYGAVASSADGVEQELPGVVAPDDTIYKINNRQVRVEKDEGVALLFDDIIEVNDDAQGNNNTELLMARTDDILEEKMGSENIPVFPGTGERHYEFKYLDLVDKNNGNVWVAANQDIVVYWPLPEGTDQNTQFALLHFEGLHREMSVGDVKDDIQTCTVTAEKITVTENHIVFTVHPAGFSPFGLVWENEGGGKGTGELAVSKTVSGVGGDTGKAFHFTVTLDDAAISGQYGEMTFINSVADFTLTHGQTVTAESLPAGTVYKVTEAEAGIEGYSTSFTGATGTIPDGGIANASFTNTKSSLVSAGSLTISKTVIGSGDKAGKFTFAITITDAQGTELSQSFPYDGSRRGMLVSGGEIALGDGESVTIQSIPAGSRYVVTEVESNQNGYVTTASGEKGSIAEEATSVAAFTNRLEKAAPPQTGDTGTPRLWTALSLASLGGLLLAFVGKRACRRKHS